MCCLYKLSRIQNTKLLLWQKTANPPQNVPPDITSDGIPLFEGCPSEVAAQRKLRFSGESGIPRIPALLKQDLKTFAGMTNSYFWVTLGKEGAIKSLELGYLF